jgi:signal transduction histidine kinase
MSSESIKVLLVEDNLGDARLMYEALEEVPSGQFQSTHVRRLSEALEHLWEKDCDVVLLDLGLPDSHGIDTLVLVRAQAPAVPIVVLTGFQDEALGDQALKEGAQDYLVKGQVNGKVEARSLRYAIARKAAEEALIRQGVALAHAGDLQRSRQRLLAVHERLRRDVAAQLRDGLQYKLLNLRSRLEDLLKGAGSAGEAAPIMSELIETLNQDIQPQVSALSRQLYPPTLSHGLVQTFQSFPYQMAPALAFDIELDEELAREEKAGGSPAPEQVRLAVYRIAEEALTNVVKHSKASKVTLRLERDREGWLRLSVRDDGQGFDLGSAPRGLGIATMEDYAANVDGECVVNSAPGAGTQVTALVPLSPPGPVPLKPLEKGDT